MAVLRAVKTHSIPAGDQDAIRDLIASEVSEFEVSKFVWLSNRVIVA